MFFKWLFIRIMDWIYDTIDSIDDGVKTFIGVIYSIWVIFIMFFFFFFYLTGTGTGADEYYTTSWSNYFLHKFIVSTPDILIITFVLPMCIFGAIIIVYKFIRNLSNIKRDYYYFSIDEKEKRKNQ